MRGKPLPSLATYLPLLNLLCVWAGWAVVAGFFIDCGLDGTKHSWIPDLQIRSFVVDYFLKRTLCESDPLSLPARVCTDSPTERNWQAVDELLERSCVGLTGEQ